MRKSWKIRKGGMILAAALLALSLGACAGKQEQATQQEPEEASSESSQQAEIDTSGGSPWIDSNLKANIVPGMETSPKDDLYLSVNYDQLLNMEIAEGDKTAAIDLGDEGRKRAAEAVSGDDLPGHDAYQAQLLYRAAMDTTARDAVGCEPAQATVDDIRSLATIDDISEFLLDSERSAGVPSLVQARNRKDPDGGSRYVTQVILSAATFGDSMGTIGMDATMVSPEDELYQVRLACASAVLTKCGLTEDEAKAAFENRVELEKRIVQDSTTDDEAEDAADPRLSLTELDELAGSFPLQALVEARGFGAAEEYLVDEAKVRAACALYTEENIELVRDYLLCGYALNAASWLDSEVFEAWRADYAALGYYDRLASTSATPEETAFDLTCSVLPTPVGRAYTEAFDLESVKGYVEGLCREAIEAHKDVVNSSEWLSDASKQRLCEKLDAITIQAVYPEVWEDYSGLDLEGLSYYEARRAIWLYDIARNAALTNEEVDNGLWSDPTLIGSTAHYDGTTNSFHVSAGVVHADVERYQAGEISLSKLMGGPVGYCVFHEIGHALDSIDISVDKDGNPMDGSLLEPDELKEFERRVQKAKDYYDSITAFKGQQVKGEVCLNEGLNEICAQRATLAYAAKQDDFDYKEFYETRPKVTCGLRTPEFEQQCIEGADTHPSAYLDVNGSTQMDEKFYETFDVKEGDGMYLAPEDRIIMW